MHKGRLMPLRFQALSPNAATSCGCMTYQALKLYISKQYTPPAQLCRRQWTAALPRRLVPACATDNFSEDMGPPGEHAMPDGICHTPRYPPNAYHSTPSLALWPHGSSRGAADMAEMKMHLESNLGCTLSCRIPGGPDARLPRRQRRR